jgi:hypothetical protein
MRDSIRILGRDPQGLILDPLKVARRDLVHFARPLLFLRRIPHGASLPRFITNVMQVSDLFVPVKVPVPVPHRLDGVVRPGQADPFPTEDVGEEILVGEHPAGDLFLIGDRGGSQQVPYDLSVLVSRGEDDETGIEERVGTRGGALGRLGVGESVRVV